MIISDFNFYHYPGKLIMQSADDNLLVPLQSIHQIGTRPGLQSLSGRSAWWLVLQKYEHSCLAMAL